MFHPHAFDCEEKVAMRSDMVLRVNMVALSLLRYDVLQPVSEHCAVIVVTHVPLSCQVFLLRTGVSHRETQRRMCNMT